MRFWMIAAGALCVAPAAGFAQTIKPAESNVVFGKSVETIPMAEWEVVQQGRAEQSGPRVLIAAGQTDVEKAPANAARYESRTFKFPTGQIRVLRFKKGSGGVVHQITFETEIYVLKGSATVDVAGKTTELRAGDAVNLPGGILRSRPKAAEDTEIIAFTVGNAAKDPKAAVIRGKDVKSEEIKGGPKAGMGAAKVAVQRYNFDGNSIRVAKLKGPGQTAPATPAGDVLIYLTSGRMKITVGDETKEVAAGDALREEAGKATHWDVLEPSTFVATNAPSIITPAPKK